MIIVLGAGITGLSLARQLQETGAQVTLVEGGETASGASGVATSYLEPRPGQTPMRQLEREALARWKDYAAELSQKTGLDVGFCNRGQLRVCLEENHARLEKDLRLREHHGTVFRRLSTAEIHQFEPELSEKIVAGALLPDVCWVTGHLVCAALETLFVAAGGTVKKHTEITGLKCTNEKVTVVAQDGSQITGDKLILCTGMGANGLAGLPCDVPQSRPVRGVNLVIDMSGLSSPLRHLVKHHRGNLCPRADGRLIVGTTYEAGEVSTGVSDNVVEMLYANAQPILPCIRDMPLLDIHAGIRAKVGDGLLRLGRSEEVPTVYYSLSHAGAGFLRAPVIAEEFAAFVLDGVGGNFTKTMTRG